MTPKSNLRLEWKSHDVDLAAFHAWALKTVPSYCGSSADYALTLWFTEEPSEEIKAAIEAKWNSLTEEEESAKIAHREKKQKAVEIAKQNLLTGSLSKLSVAERKLLMSMPLTEEDKEALVVKFKKKLDEDPANDEDVEEGEA
jgi:hypothetical protein